MHDRLVGCNGLMEAFKTWNNNPRTQLNRNCRKFGIEKHEFRVMGIFDFSKLTEPNFIR